jgi:hypothetical protein
LLSVTNTVIANQNSTIDNYNTRYTPQGRISQPFFLCSVSQNLTVTGLLFGVGIVCSSLLLFWWFWFGGSNYHILEYDKDIYKNLDYISGTMTCRSFGKSRDIKIKIKKPPLRDNGSIVYNKSVKFKNFTNAVISQPFFLMVFFVLFPKT